MKVLIVGAGIAGPTLAYWLLRAGHEPTLVERARELRRGGYLIDFWGAGFEVAERMGIIAELQQRGYRLSEARSVNGAGRRIGALDPTAFVGAAQGRYLSIARSDLAAVIVGALRDRVELILDDTVAALDDDGERVHVSFESGRARDFDLVVGADGLHSRVRRLVFGPEGDFENYQNIVVSAFDVEGYRPRDENVAVMYAAVGFQVMRLALRDDITMFLVTARYDGSVPTDGVEAEQTLLRELLRDGGWETSRILELMPKARTFYFDRVSQIRMPAWTRGRVALIGDAAACPSLLAGQGSALSMVAAYVLAAELARSDDHVQAFAAYQDRLAAFLRAKQDAAVGLGLAFAPRGRLQLVVRNATMRVIGLPCIGELLLGKSFQDAIDLPAFAAG